MTASPLVSVLMSVHNGCRYVEEAVDSILSQTMADFEFIIIDDGSTDGVTQVLKQYVRRDSRIRLVIQDNAGLTRSLNLALSLARGDLIARMDADDISHPRRLALQAQSFEREAELVVLGSQVELITEDGLVLGEKRQELSHSVIRARLLSGDGSALVHPAVMFRREAAVSIGGYDEAFDTAQDLDLFLRLTDMGKAANLPDTLLKWRQHSKSINRLRSSTWPRVKAAAIEKTIERIGARMFAQQLFAAERAFHFPSTDLELGTFAWASGRSWEALRLYARTLGKGPYRLSALRRLVFAAVVYAHRSILKTVIPSKDRSVETVERFD